MKSKIVQVIALCGILLSFVNCKSKPYVYEGKPDEVNYNISIGDSDFSSFLLSLSKNNFSFEFNPFLAGDEKSFGFFKMTDWKAENNFVNVLIDLYRVGENFYYSSEIHIFRPDFEARVFKEFLEEGNLESWYVRGLFHDKSIEVFDENGDGKLESIIYDDYQIGPLSNEDFRVYLDLKPISLNLRDIVFRGYNLYYNCRREMERLGLCNKD